MDIQLTPKELQRAEQVEREAETAAQERRRLREKAIRGHRARPIEPEPEGEGIEIGLHEGRYYWDRPAVSECLKLIRDARAGDPDATERADELFEGWRVA